MRTSIVMPVLLFLSILVVALAIERLWQLWFAERLPEKTWERVRAKLEKGDRTAALAICRQMEGVMGEALTRLLSLKNTNMESLVEAFQLYRQRLQIDLSRRVGFFGTVSFIAPLIGLMGTVLGIIRAFHDLAAAGAGGPSVVAAGISEALVTTAAGIAVAVMAAVLYNYFTLTVRTRLSTVDLWIFELAEVLENAPASSVAGVPTPAPAPMQQAPSPAPAPPQRTS
ncbi:MAG: MotA/TolQ/ExbB proton channel family protein [Elusimicrobia bacterium]|nr:MotA/TolQ/ExbB proton channel family protein [Elusimicrobiota bacterium]